MPPLPSMAFFISAGSNGFCPRGGERARFDQEPVEAQSMFAACLPTLVMGSWGQTLGVMGSDLAVMGSWRHGVRP